MAEYRIRGLHPALLRRAREKAYGLGWTLPQGIIAAIEGWVDGSGLLERLQAERGELEQHTHGFAYPECPKCSRLAELNKLLDKP